MKKIKSVRSCLIITIVAELLILLALSGVVFAKYAKTLELTNSLTIHAELGNIALYEHKAVKDDWGEYHLEGIETEKCEHGKHIHVQSNEYTFVIPGLDIPKDPWVSITNKTEIPAYVFLIVTETNWPGTMTYTLEGHWKEVEGYPGVYVYSDAKGPIEVTGNIDKIGVLVDDSITVSQKYTGPVEATLTFTARMGQVGTDLTASQVYSQITP